MKTLNRILSLVCAFMLLVGCGAALAEGQKLEPVTLEWYVAEDSQPDNAAVFDTLNAYFQEKINTTVNFHFIPYSEYADKVGTILMSGQDVDIVNANGAVGYVDYVNKDSFVAIEDLLKDYAPNTYALIPEGLWDAMKINGHIYGIPSYKDSVQMYSVMINKTMADDCGIELPETVKDYRDMVPILREASFKLRSSDKSKKRHAGAVHRAYKGKTGAQEQDQGARGHHVRPGPGGGDQRASGKWCQPVMAEHAGHRLQ